MASPPRFGRIRDLPDPQPFEIVWTRTGGFDPKTREPLPLYDDHGQRVGGIETFHARPELPGGVMIDLLGVEEGRGQAVVEFLDVVVIGEDLARWHALTHDPDRLVLAEDLEDVAKWLVQEVYGGTPTTPPASSARGRSRSGAGSRARR